MLLRSVFTPEYIANHSAFHFSQIIESAPPLLNLLRSSCSAEDERGRDEVSAVKQAVGELQQLVTRDQGPLSVYFTAVRDEEPNIFVRF